MLAANRTVLVTGAAGGIGAATARQLAAHGDRVLLLDRDERVTQLAAELPAASALVRDLADPDVPAAVADFLTEMAGGLDILVHAAGIALGTDARLLDVNLSAGLRLVRAVVPLLRESSSGRIVTVGSVQAERAGADSVAYAASKGGLHAATRALAVDLASDGILVNAVAPGFIETPMSVLPDGRTEFETDWFQSVYVEHAGVPLRRPGMPDEVATVIRLLLTPENTYMTGSVVAVDGGLGAAL
jgi:3-oxoacyl-[acyl-carrier protein] reductase